MKFFIKVPDQFVEGFLGIYGNEYFNKKIYVFELDYQKGKIKLVGILPGTTANEMMLKFYGYRDLTDEFMKIYGKQPTEIRLFTFDITELVETNRRLKLLIKKLIGQK